MLIIIDIPEESYKNIKEQVDKRDYPDMQIGRAIADGVLIPESRDKQISHDEEAYKNRLHISSEELKKAIHDYDLLLKPFIICCNPADENVLKEKLGNSYLYVSNLAVPEGNIFIVDREKAEEDYLNDLGLG